MGAPLWHFYIENIRRNGQHSNWNSDGPLALRIEQHFPVWRKLEFWMMQTQRIEFRDFEPMRAFVRRRIHSIWMRICGRTLFTQLVYCIIETRLTRTNDMDELKIRSTRKHFTSSDNVLKNVYRVIFYYSIGFVATGHSVISWPHENRQVAESTSISQR